MTATCAWCKEGFEPRRTGGSPQRFCKSAHRRAFDRAAFRYVGQAIDAGTLTVADLEAALGPRAPRGRA